MLSRCVAAFAVLALSSCGPLGGENAAEITGCVAEASMPWRPLSGVEFQTSAHTEGADCATAQATIVVADAGGNALYSETYPVEHVAVLMDMASREQMGAALASWIDQNGEMLSTADKLPDWPAGTPQPTSGEFPFYPEENVTRDDYLAARASGAPLFCFVQGMESIVCLILRDGALTKLGAQSFPG
jgi:hypothetical protein